MKRRERRHVIGRSNTAENGSVPSSGESRLERRKDNTLEARLSLNRKALYEARKKKLLVKRAQDKLWGLLQKFPDPRVAFLNCDIGMKGFIFSEEMIRQLQSKTAGNLTREELEALLDLVPGPGGHDSFDYDRFSKMLHAEFPQLPQPIRRRELEKDDPLYKIALQKLRESLTRLRKEAEPPITRSDGEMNNVLEKWVRTTFDKKQTVTEYDQLVEAVESLGLDLDRTELEILLSSADTDSQGFFTIPNLLIGLLKESAPVEIPAFVPLENICNTATREIALLREKQAIADGKLTTLQELPPKRQVEALLPLPRNKLSRPSTTPAQFGGTRKEQLPFEIFANERRQRKEMLFTQPRPVTSEDTRDKKLEKSFSHIMPRLKRTTRNGSTPVLLDTRPRIGFGSGGVDTQSHFFLEDQKRLHTTSSCAFQPPSRVKTGAMLEFSASFEAAQRRAKDEQRLFKKSFVTRTVEHRIKTRERTEKLEYWAAKKAKAQLKVNYLKSTAEPPRRQVS